MAKTIRMGTRTRFAVLGLVAKLRHKEFSWALKLALLRFKRCCWSAGSYPNKPEHPFDAHHGTETSAIVEIPDLDLPDDRLSHASRYQTAIVEVFNEILGALNIPHEEFVFVDLGSGKGRALLLASRHPFKEIVGVELSPTLHHTASHNIMVYRDELQLCHNIKTICADAAEFGVPEGKVVFYLFNPFDEVVMRSVLSNIERAFLQSRREMYIAYLKPAHRRVFDQSKLLRVFHQTDRFVIYVTRPE
jgi:hypothetical protein